MINNFIIFLFVQTIQPQFILDQLQVLNYEFYEKLKLNPLFRRNCLNDRERLCKLHADSLSPQSEEIISIANDYLDYFGDEDPDQYQRLINQMITQYVYRQDEYQTYALIFQGLRNMIQNSLNISIGINSKEREILPVQENTTKKFDILITFENLYISKDGKYIYTTDQEGMIYFNSSVNLGTIKMNSTSILASYFNQKKTLFKTRSMVELLQQYENNLKILFYNHYYKFFVLYIYLNKKPKFIQSQIKVYKLYDYNIWCWNRNHKIKYQCSLLNSIYNIYD